MNVRVSTASEPCAPRETCANLYSYLTGSYMVQSRKNEGVLAAVHSRKSLTVF